MVIYDNKEKDCLKENNIFKKIELYNHHIVINNNYGIHLPKFYLRK